MNQFDIQGQCQPGFNAMEQAFKRSFAEFGERGAALTIFHRGEKVVDLWGGSRDKAETQPWLEDTCVNIFSAGKAFVAVCVLRLVQQGVLDLEAPVAKYWPEFAQNGKQEVTVAQVLCHRSGVSAFTQPIADGDIYDWAKITAAVAAAEPWWTPGQDQGYSPMIFGWMAGELARRAAGAATFNQLFQQLVAEPLGIGAWFGVPEDILAVIADVGAVKAAAPADAAGSLMGIMAEDRNGLTAKAFTNPMSIMTGTNSPQWRQGQIPGGNGSSNARALAIFYNALISSDILLDEQHRPLLWQCISRTEQDRTLATPLSFSHGFMLSDERPECRFGRGARGFGHPGAGGSLGFADPDYDIAFAYTPNGLGQSVLLDRRAIALLDQLYKILEVQ